MNKLIFFVLFILFAVAGLDETYSQTGSTSDYLLAQPVPHRMVPFDVTEPGISKTVEFGADLAWANEQNFRRAVRFMGIDQVDVARLSFQPTHALIDGDLQQSQINDLNYRISLLLNYTNPNTKVTMNSDHPSVDEWYVGNPANWVALYEATANRIQATGRTIISIAPFNEPDYTATGQGTIDDFYNIVVEMRDTSFFDNMRISGGNVLNCDFARDYYQYLRPAGVNEGNTHQLAGVFDSYANFLQLVRANGDWASNDELHNVMEALVGYEYGMQMGIWWGPADLARGQMVQAFDGQRIAYAEHRPNWTAAAVYRTPEGKIQAFGGTSERQAVTTSYSFISKDRAVYYDGRGPLRNFVLEMPGGTGYWSGQTNAERVINITWGEDIQPEINGRYKLVNRQSRLVMVVAGDASQNGANVEQGTYSGTPSEQWDVVPVDSRIGGDFSYYRIYPASGNNKYLDLYNFSLDNGANVNLWDKGYYGNQQWYLDYVEDGWFIIRSRESAYCLDVESASDNIHQWEKTGNQSQQWRFLPIDAPIEFDAPTPPADLAAFANAVSIQLNWAANTEPDVTGYDIFRSDVSGGPYNTIGRDVAATSFVDNTVNAGKEYFYVIKAVDHSVNHSLFSNEVSAIATGEQNLVAHLSFDENTKDHSVNLNHGAAAGGTFVQGCVGSGALSLNGTNEFVQLPADLVNHQEISIAFWINWNGGLSNQNIFEFKSSDGQYMYLSPSIGGQMQLAIRDNGGEQTMNGTSLPIGEWSHVAVILAADGAFMYVDGTLVTESTDITIRPLDFKPVMNFIGINQYNKRYFKGIIDDFRVYNYSLTIEEIGGLASYLYIETIETGSTEAGNGYAEILVLDNQGDPVKDATVTGSFNGTFTESVSGTTDADGIVYFQTVAQQSGNVVVDFCVEDITHASLKYSQAQSQIICSESVITGIVEQLQVRDIYPNPTSDILHIGYESIEEMSKVKLIDISGRTVVDTQLIGEDRYLDVSAIRSGIYIVKIMEEGRVFTQRVIKK